MTLTQIKSAGLSKPINLADNERIRLGSGNDLQLYHNGTNSVIADTGNGNLSLQTNGTDINLWNSTDSEYLARFIRNGAVELYHDSSKKFETFSTGAKWHGFLFADDNSSIRIGNGADLQLYHTGSASFIDNSGTGIFYIRGNGSNSLRIRANPTEDSILCNPNGNVQLYADGNKKFETTAYGAEFIGDLGVNRTAGGYTFREVTGGDERAGIHSNAANDLIFKVAGASEAARFTASTARLGIGTTSPAAPLHIQKSGTSQNLLTLESDLGTNNNRTLIIGGPTSDSGSAPFRFTTGNSLLFRIDSTDALTIADNGRIGIGTTSPSSILTTEQSTGNINLELHATGSGRGSQVKCHNDHGTAYLGLAGNTNGELLIYQETNAPTLFHTNGQERMRLLAGGGLTFNGDTAAANALDDYEEGTFTPTSNNGLGAAEGSYTKIGRQVTLHIRVTVDTNSNSNAMVIGGFPFNASMPSGLSNGSTPSGFGYISGSVINGGIQIHTRYNSNETNFYTFGTNLQRSHFSGRELRFGLVYHVA